MEIQTLILQFCCSEQYSSCQKIRPPVPCNSYHKQFGDKAVSPLLLLLWQQQLGDGLHGEEAFRISDFSRSCHHHLNLVLTWNESKRVICKTFLHIRFIRLRDACPQQIQRTNGYFSKKKHFPKNLCPPNSKDISLQKKHFPKNLCPPNSKDISFQKKSMHTQFIATGLQRQEPLQLLNPHAPLRIG